MLNEQIKVSAIIITHNRAELLVRAIESVKKQSYKNIEIIVIDDASTDGTYNICSNMEGIKYIQFKHSCGGNHARNVGIEQSSGEYVAFLDDDDYWYENKIEKQVEYAKNNMNCGVIYSGYLVDYSSKIYNYKWFPRKDYCGNLIGKQLFISPFCCTITLFVKKDLLELTGGFDEKVRYWQEYELLLRLMQLTEIGFVNEVLAVANRDRKVKRLTNNLDGWLESVNYINEKHKQIFDALSDENKKNKLKCFYQEAAYRASASGDKKKMRFYYKKAFKLSHKIEYWIRWVFGISRQQTLLLECFIKRITCRKK